MPAKKVVTNKKKFEALMNGTNKWQESLEKVDHDIEKLKTVTKQVNKLEKARMKYGSNVSLTRKMTLTNFDEIVSVGSRNSSKSRRRPSNLNVIKES